MTPVRVYSRNFLLNVGQVVTRDRPSVPLETIRALRINNIYLGPKTHRGVSSGVNKRRKEKSLGQGLTVGSLNIQSVRNKTDTQGYCHQSKHRHRYPTDAGENLHS